MEPARVHAAPRPRSPGRRLPDRGMRGTRSILPLQSPRSCNPLRCERGARSCAWDTEFAGLPPAQSEFPFPFAELLDVGRRAYSAAADIRGSPFVPAVFPFPYSRRGNAPTPGFPGVRQWGARLPSRKDSHASVRAVNRHEGPAMSGQGAAGHLPASRPRSACIGCLRTREVGKHPHVRRRTLPPRSARSCTDGLWAVSVVGLTWMVPSAVEAQHRGLSWAVHDVAAQPQSPASFDATTVSWSGTPQR